MRNSLDDYYYLLDHPVLKNSASNSSKKKDSMEISYGNKISPLFIADANRLNTKKKMKKFIHTVAISIL